MSHEITSTDRLILNSGLPAWHGLGEVINQELSPKDGVRRAIPWEPESRPVYIFNPLTGLHEEVGGYRANVRDDNGVCLGLVSDGYTIVPNRTLGDFAEAIAGADAAVQVETAGSLMGGRRVFLLCRLPNAVRVGRGGADETVPYLAISNTHDGSAALFAMWTGIRIVCNNTLGFALGANFENAEQAADTGRAFRFRHTGDIMSRVDEARRALAIATTTTERFQRLAEALAGKSLSAAELAEYFGACYVAIYGVRPEGPGQVEQGEAWDLRRSARLTEWTAMMDHERQTVAGIGGTAWAALQAVTDWHDHTRSAARVKGQRRQHSNLFGESARDKRGAFAAAIALLSR